LRRWRRRAAERIQSWFRGTWLRLQLEASAQCQAPDEGQPGELQPVARRPVRCPGQRALLGVARTLESQRRAARAVQDAMCRAERHREQLARRRSDGALSWQERAIISAAEQQEVRKATEKLAAQRMSRKQLHDVIQPLEFKRMKS